MLNFLDLATLFTTSLSLESAASKDAEICRRKNIEGALLHEECELQNQFIIVA
jgi:hypothetical protein